MGRKQRREQAVDDAEIAGAVEPRGLDDLVGHREQRLAHEEGAERARAEGQHQRGHGVHQARLPQEEKDRHEGHLRGDQKAHQDQAERRASPHEAQLGESEARGQRERDLQERDEQRHHGGVDEVAPHGNAGPHLAVGAKVRVFGKSASGSRKSSGSVFSEVTTIHRYGPTQPSAATATTNRTSVVDPVFTLPSARATREAAGR